MVQGKGSEGINSKKHYFIFGGGGGGEVITGSLWGLCNQDMGLTLLRMLNECEGSFQK